MVQYPNDEAPPDYYAVSGAQPKSRAETPRGSPPWWWLRKKREWVPGVLVIALVIFGIIFGAVYGVKQSQLDRNSSSSSTWPAYPTGTPGYPYPTPAPSPPTTPLLKAQGKVPRDISVAAEAPNLLIWDLRAEGRLWFSASESSGSWEVYPNRHFLFAPVSVGTGDFRARNAKQTAVSVDAGSGRIVYMQYAAGRWGDWQDLEFDAQFLRRPAVLSRTQDRVDVVGIDSEGRLWIVSYDGAQWSEWTELGVDMNGEVSATSWREDRIDVFAKSRGKVMHKYWNEESGWAEQWDDLGNPFASSYSDSDDEYGSPLAASWRSGDDGVIDVFVTSGTSRHKMFQAGAWGDWLIVPASHEGGEFIDTQSIAQKLGRGNEPYAHILSRGTNNCVHYISHNGSEWDRWTYLWCNRDEVEPGLYYPTEFMPTYVVAMENGNLELVVKNMPGDVLRQLLFTPVDDDRQWKNEDWTNVGRSS